jgi:hypothetical protein
MGLDPQVVLTEGDEHREVHHPVWCQIMKPQPEVVKELVHKQGTLKLAR